MEDRPRLHAVLPAKGFGHAKSRLSPALPPEAREALARQMCERALDAAQSCAAIEDVLVATDGDDVAALCDARGIAVLRDPLGPRLGLAALIDRALVACESRGATHALVLMADLPRVTARAVARVLEAEPGRELVLVPDARGRGTNALRLPLGRAFTSSFGHPDSKTLHLREAERLGLSVAVLECASLALDLDRPSELEAATEAGLKLQHAT